MNNLADKQMMTHNGGRKGLVLGLELGLGRGASMEEGSTVKRGGRVGGKGKNNRMNQTTLLYVNL